MPAFQGNDISKVREITSILLSARESRANLNDELFVAGDPLTGEGTGAADLQAERAGKSQDGCRDARGSLYWLTAGWEWL